MPRWSVGFIRFSLAYVVLGFSFGALMLANKAVAFVPGLDRLIPAHSEILLMGWLVQLALGVAYWILPRFTNGSPRGNPAAAWSSFFSLNAGILLAALGELAGPAWLVLLGRLFEAASILVFLRVVWGRIRDTTIPR